MVAELRAKLDAPNLDLEMGALHASDTAGKSRSFKQYIEAGLDPRDAAREVGSTLDYSTRDPQPSGPPAPEDDEA